jgi:predicted metal-dependent phosphoesterase TrpH
MFESLHNHTTTSDGELTHLEFLHHAEAAVCIIIDNKYF